MSDYHEEKKLTLQEALDKTTLSIVFYVANRYATDDALADVDEVLRVARKIGPCRISVNVDCREYVYDDQGNMIEWRLASIRGPG